jgi:hypothetical protein
MIELLALPGWRTPPTPLDAWVARLTTPGASVVVARESSDVSWLEVAPLRLRGYAMLAGPFVEAINFELSAPDPAPAAHAVVAAAEALGWEVHRDDDADGDDDEDDNPA